MDRTDAQHGHSPPRTEPLSDRMITPERSVFGTRAPRPTGVGRHLIVVVVLSVLAIGVAIAFAERDAPGAPVAGTP